MSDTDPLATLLHKTANYCMGHKDPFSEQPDCDIIAARLRAAGVTLTQPQGFTDDEWRQRHEANEALYQQGYAAGVTLTQPQPDAGLREAAQAVVDDWFGTYDPEVRIPSAAENIDALRAALRPTPAVPKEDDR